MDSQFKRFRQAFGPGPMPAPRDVIASSLQQSPDPMTSYAPADPSGPGPNKPLAMNTYDIPQRAPIFQGVDSSMPQIHGVEPQLDYGMDIGQSADKAKAEATAVSHDRRNAMIVGGLQGLASSGAGSPDVNFGEAFSRAAGVAGSGIQGSMHTAADRRAAEDDRARQIDEMFFQRSTKLQELSIARRKADAEVSRDNQAAADRQTGFGLRDRGLDIAGRRNDLMQSGQDQSAAHNKVVEEALLTNAGSSRIRATAVAKKAEATAPRSGKALDGYARTRTYIQFGAADADGKIIDTGKQAQIDAGLRMPGRKANQFQQVYQKARVEGAKSTVDPTVDDGSDGEDPNQ